MLFFFKQRTAYETRISDWSSDVCSSDLLKANQLPKVETYGDQLFLITRTANLDGDTIQPGETAFFIGPHFFVSVRHGSARTHTDVRARLETLPAKIAHGPGSVLYAVPAFIVDGYFPVNVSIRERWWGGVGSRVEN